jgi:serine protease
MSRSVGWLAGWAGLVAAGLIGSSDRAVIAQEAGRRVAIPTPALEGMELGAPSEADVLRTLASSSQPRDLPGAYLSGRVLVKFRAGGGAAQARARTLQQAGARASRTPEFADFEVMEIDPAADATAVASALAAQPDVEYAQPDYRVHKRFRPNDPDYSRQWNFPAIGMEEAWDINRGATASIIVAVLDSGMAFRNVSFTYFAPAFRRGNALYPALGNVTVPFAAAPDLASANRFAAPRDFIWNDTDPVDLDGHGTHVAGTIGQLTNNSSGGAGMAFNVRLMPVKVISTDWDDIFDSPNFGSDAIIAQGIRYAVDNGARVLNMSIGRSGGPAPAVEDALRYAVSRGAFVAISAGNDFEEGNPEERFAEIAGRIEGVMCVAAVGRDLNRASYSSVKPYVEIAAPGGDFRSGGLAATVVQQSYDPVIGFSDPLSSPPSVYRAPRFDAFVQLPNQGTSMAAPHVSGLAALLMQQGITNPAAIEAALKEFATDRGAAGRDDEYGFGLINPRATLRGLGVLR